MMESQYRSFKQCFLRFIDKILTLEHNDSMIKGLYNLVEKFLEDLLNLENFKDSDANSLIVSLIKVLTETYLLPKLNIMIQVRAGYLLSKIFTQREWKKIQLDTSMKDTIFEIVIDLMQQKKVSLISYGVQICAQICKFENQQDPLVINYFRQMTHSQMKEVRKIALVSLKTPITPLTLLFVGKRLRDKDAEIRKLTFQILIKNKITLEHFESKEQRMLIMKEGMTDQDQDVRQACSDFVIQSIEDKGEKLSHLFKIIDCKQMHIKEYYSQLPFLIMNLVIHKITDPLLIPKFLQNIVRSLKIKAQIDVRENQEEHMDVVFEDILFLRIALEFEKMVKMPRSQEYQDEIDKIVPDYEEYQIIFDYLNQEQDRLKLSEWVKFSLQMTIEDEITRKAIVNKMFQFIADMNPSYQDYQHLLTPQKMVINHWTIQNDPRVSFELDEVDGRVDYEAGEERVEQKEEDQTIEIEIREFNDLGNRKDIHEYCKPYKNDFLVMDSDDIARLAVIVCRRLLDERPEEFSLSMLQAVSDVKEPLEQEENDHFKFQPLKIKYMAKIDDKFEEINDLLETPNYSIEHLNRLIKKLRKLVVIIEELTLKEKLHMKRALNLCLILLKNCKADVDDQDMINICQSIIAPAVQSKDKVNMLLGLECIGLLCLLDKEVFQNYSTIFQTILLDDLTAVNIYEKVIALKASVDSLIIHGADSKTQKLQKIIVEDYLMIKNKFLRQITIEGVTKMLFSRKLALNVSMPETEAIISQLIIQWFDKYYNWQNSLVRQVLNNFFKSFILFSGSRCQIMLVSLLNVMFSIFESKYGGKIQRKVLNNKNTRKSLSEAKARSNKRQSKFSDESYTSEGDYVSDDSTIITQKAKMQKVCSQLNVIQITKVFMYLMSKEYINSKTDKQFQINHELNLEFICAVATMNTQYFKKVAFVKEYLSSIINFIDISQCDSINILQQLKLVLDKNARMLITGNGKIKAFVTTIDKKIESLKSLLQEQGREEELLNLQQDPDASVQELDLVGFINFYQDYILDRTVDLVIDNDEDFNEIRKAQNLLPKPFSPVHINSRHRVSGVSQLSAISQQSQKGIQTRSQAKKKNQQLQVIRESEEVKERESSQVKKKKQNLCETIVEEVEQSEKEESPIHGQNEGERRQYNSNAYNDREVRHGLMSRISKEVAKTFQQNKKRSLQNSGQSFTQINEQRVKEEYDDKTVYKLSKSIAHEISPIQASHQERGLNEEQKFSFIHNKNRNSSDSLENIPHNLSLRFEAEAQEESKIKPVPKSKKAINISNSKVLNESLNSLHSNSKDSIKAEAKGIMTRNQRKLNSQNNSSDQDSDENPFGFFEGKVTRQARKLQREKELAQIRGGKRLRRDQDVSIEREAQKENKNIKSNNASKVGQKKTRTGKR